jgi:hypothetical protein
VYGVLFWGITTGLLFSIVFYFAMPHGNPDQKLGLFCTFPLWPLAGYIFGALAWRSNEWKYEETVLLLKAAGRRDDHPDLEEKPASEGIHRPHDFFTR